MASDVNFLFISYDSCRWDAFNAANTPHADSLGRSFMAHAHATFTLGAHIAMLQGLLPHCPLNLPFLNRYVCQLVRIQSERGLGESLISFPIGTRDICQGFRDRGYVTWGLGAVGWFKHPLLVNPFDDFVFTGIYAARQVSLLEERVVPDVEQPFFALLNFGETHHPYRFDPYKAVPPEPSPARMSRASSSPIDRGWEAQVRCCEYLDRQLGRLLRRLRSLERNTVVALCGDHGECFGEDGLWGHGFYHQKVMEVPLLVADIQGRVVGDCGGELVSR